MPVNPLQLPSYAQPTPTDFSSLANLGKVYDEAKDKRTLADLGKGLADGTLDYKQAAGLAAGAGKLDVAMSLMKLGEEKQQQSDFTNNFGQLLGSGSPPAAPSSYSPQPRTMGSIGQPQTVDPNQVNSIDAMADLKPGTQAKMATAQGAVSGIESGGRYDAVGPAIASGQMAGQRAIGKYGVMESNVGPWTKAVLGRAMTPQEFAANPDAQDAVFNGRFGGYMDKYGSDGAGRAWHAGEGGMNNPTARDQLGTSTPGYGNRVAGIVDGDGGALPPNARPAGMQVADASGRSVPAQQQPQQEGQPTPRTNPLQNNIPALMYIMSAPGASAGQKKMAEIALTEAIKSPDNLKEYDFYQRQEASQGRRPLPLLDWTVKIKQAGATSITTDMRGENAQAVSIGKHYGDTFVDMQKQGAAAGGAITNLQVMDRLASNPNFYSGSGGNLVLKARQVATSLGIADADKAAPSELFQKLSSKVVLDAAGGSLGTGFSNADRDFLQGTVANLSNTPEGNKAIIQLGIQVEKRKQEVAKIARDYFKQNGGKLDSGFDEHLAQWASANPLIEKLQGNPLFRQQPQAPQSNATQAAPKAMPQAGTVEQGYRFKGGDPSKPESWEPAQ